MTDSERLEAIRKAATEHLERALHCLRNMPCGGVGEDGPTLEELDDYVGTHSAPMENDAPVSYTHLTLPTILRV